MVVLVFCLMDLLMLLCHGFPPYLYLGSRSLHLVRCVFYCDKDRVHKHDKYIFEWRHYTTVEWHSEEAV